MNIEHGLPHLNAMENDDAKTAEKGGFFFFDSCGNPKKISCVPNDA